MSERVVSPHWAGVRSPRFLSVCVDKVAGIKGSTGGRITLFEREVPGDLDGRRTHEGRQNPGLETNEIDSSNRVRPVSPDFVGSIWFATVLSHFCRHSTGFCHVDRKDVAG
jgi:hypothetical protein